MTLHDTFDKLHYYIIFFTSCLSMLGGYFVGHELISHYFYDDNSNNNNINNSDSGSDYNNYPFFQWLLGTIFILISLWVFFTFVLGIILILKSILKKIRMLYYNYNPINEYYPLKYPLSNSINNV